MKKITDRNTINGEDFNWKKFVEPRRSTTIHAGEVGVTATGGTDTEIRSKICGTGVPINFTKGDKLIGTKFIDGDFTDPIRIEFSEPVRAAGVQFAVISDTNNLQFTALIRVSTELNAGVFNFSNDNAVVTDVMDNSAIFLGAEAEDVEKIKVIRIDVKPRGVTTASDILSFYINQIRVAL